MEDEIQPAVGEAILDIQASTSDVAETRVALENFLGVTEENRLLQLIVDAMRKTEEERDTDENKRQTYKIQRVPGIMWRNKELEKYFKPRELSIGPIHSNDWKLLKAELKGQLAAYFLNEIRKKRADSGSLFTKFESRMHDIDIYMFFEEKVIKPADRGKLLMQLLFLDGCAILGFAKAYLLGILNRFNISTDQAALIRQDLFLLENQIPFQVLKELINLTDEDELVWLQIFIITSNTTFPRDSKKTSHVVLPEPGKDTVHLLDLVRREFLVVHNHDPDKFFKCLFSCGEVAHTNYGMHREQSNKFDMLSENWKEKHFFRKIRELQAAGIKFEPTDSLRDVSFLSQFSTTGQLVLPTLVVDNLTPCMLMNLVAYEMCLSKTHAYNSGDDVKKSWVTSYVNLLDLLIDDEQDVKDLRAAGVLRNFLSSDSEVAQLINTVGSHCPAPPEDMYEHVKNQIGRHSRKRSAVWMSQVYRTHFSSPWTILALIAAIVVLGLTAAQTYYAVHPNS